MSFPIHVCGVCGIDSMQHMEDCYEKGCEDVIKHWPPLCCEGCLCGSFEEAHPVRRVQESERVA